MIAIDFLPDEEGEDLSPRHQQLTNCNHRRGVVQRSRDYNDGRSNCTPTGTKISFDLTIRLRQQQEKER